VASSAPRRPALILASASPRRFALLEQIGLKPDATQPADIDETPRKGEKGRALAARLAREKAAAAAAKAPPTSFVLAADTVVWAAGRILPKAGDAAEAAECLRLLSGRSHRVYTGLALATPAGKLRERLVETRVRFKRLSHAEIAAYLASGEWSGKAGGYAIQGLAGAFAQTVVGSYSSVVGLPLYETMTLLGGEGYPIHARWADAAP